MMRRSRAIRTWRRAKKSRLIRFESLPVTSPTTSARAFFCSTRRCSRSANLLFLELGTPFPANNSSSGPVAYHPMTVYADVLDLLRNESPVYIETDNQDGAWIAAFGSKGRVTFLHQSGRHHGFRRHL